MKRESHQKQQVTTSTASPAGYYEPINPELHEWLAKGWTPMNVPVSTIKVEAKIVRSSPAFTNPNKEDK